MAENWSLWIEEYMKLALSILYQGVRGLSIVASEEGIMGFYHPPSRLTSRNSKYVKNHAGTFLPNNSHMATAANPPE